MITKLSLVPKCSVCTRPGGTGKTGDAYLIGDLNRRLRIETTNLDSDKSVAGNDITKLMVVASGHGIMSGRMEAATLAVETVCDYLLNSMHRFVKLADERDKEFRDELAVALERCQRRVALHQAANPDLADIGVSMTLLYVAWPRAYLVHVGNTACFLSRNQHVRKLTTDHTLAQKLVRGATRLPSDSTRSKTIWNCIGGIDANIAPEIVRCDLRLGDRLILCSHGLTDHVNVSELEDVFEATQSQTDPQRLATRLAEAAVRNADKFGTVHDDVTVITANF